MDLVGGSHPRRGAGRLAGGLTPTLRPASPEDEPFLLALTARLAAFPVPAWRTREEIAAADHAILLDALHHPGPQALILVAESPPGIPAGYVFVSTKQDYFTGRPHAHVEVLAVTEAAQGRGVARALMAAAEEWARARGDHAITLNVFDLNAAARGLYDRLGYQPETVHYRKGLHTASKLPSPEE
jgi:GNAT superfamily N-acetyltransferase